MTPELEKLTRQRKFQLTSREITHQDEIKEENKPVTDNEGNILMIWVQRSLLLSIRRGWVKKLN